MYMTVSKISRKDATDCTDSDISTVVPALPSHEAFQAYVVARQAEGKVIYRSHSINDAKEVETVTLYAAQADYDAFKVDASFTALVAELAIIYDSVVTEETI
jgi:hypothetical protein